ncbi:MAG: ribonuclease HI [Aquabacterium sp.]
MTTPTTTTHPVTIYTDGACKGNPGPGGWGCVFTKGPHKMELWGSEAQTTSNQMELMAAIRGLERLTMPSVVTVFSDSQYLCKGMREWLPGWEAKGWKTADGKPVKNVDLWVRLKEAAKGHAVTWQWVRGHAGHPGNERADALASAAALRAAA